jgi:hypothetical protein
VVVVEVVSMHEPHFTGHCSRITTLDNEFSQRVAGMVMHVIGSSKPLQIPVVAVVVVVV